MASARARRARALFPAFWNEFLFRLNSCRRKGLNPAASGYFVVAAGAGAGRSPLLIARYYAASLINLLLLICRTQKRPEGNGPLFLFTNLRHGRFFREGVAPVRAGLYNLRYLRYPHLLALLSAREIVGGLWLALRTYPAVRADGRARCAAEGVDWAVFRRLTLFGRLRYADAVLHALALEKHGGEVWCPGHFDLYVSVLSIARERESVRRFVGMQHGLFEYPPAPHAFERLFTDAYHVLIPESRPWIESHFLKNPACEVVIEAREGHIAFQTLERDPGGRVIAFAAQEIAPADEALVERLLAIKARAPMPVEVLLYSHPLYPCENTGWAERGLLSHSRDRHANIDVLITRFSTLGLDYHRIGVPVLFVPFGDGVCIFDHPDFTVCGDLDAMEAALARVLGL